MWLTTQILIKLKVGAEKHNDQHDIWILKIDKFGVAIQRWL